MLEETEFRWERVKSRRGGGLWVLAECPGAHLQSCCVVASSFGLWCCAGWGLSLFLTTSLVFSFCSLFPLREKLQCCLVLEWLQGKTNISLAFSSFCAVCSSSPDTPFCYFYLFFYHLNRSTCLPRFHFFPYSGHCLPP